MDADLLGLKKSRLASSQSAAKGSGKEELPSNSKPAGMFTASGKGQWDIVLRSREALGVWEVFRRKLSCAVGFLCLGWRGQELTMYVSVYGGGEGDKLSFLPS